MSSDRESELEAVREENQRLADQVKRLLQTEGKFYEARDKLDSQVRLYRNLYELGKSLSATKSIDQVAELAIRFVLYQLEFERCVVAPVRARAAPWISVHFDGYYQADANRVRELILEKLS